jgi:hypothetical protein
VQQLFCISEDTPNEGTKTADKPHIILFSLTAFYCHSNWRSDGPASGQGKESVFFLLGISLFTTKQ